MRAYDSHSLKDIFDVGGLELVSVAKSFGFSVPPFVELPIAHKNKVGFPKPYPLAAFV